MYMSMDTEYRGLGSKLLWMNSLHAFYCGSVSRSTISYGHAKSRLSKNFHSWIHFLSNAKFSIHLQTFFFFPRDHIQCMLDQPIYYTEGHAKISVCVISSVSITCRQRQAFLDEVRKPRIRSFIIYWILPLQKTLIITHCKQGLELHYWLIYSSATRGECFTI